MANTKIPVELSSTPGIVDGSNATAITINSNEQVGLGTTPPTDTHATWSQFFIGQKGSLISEKSGTGGIYGTILSDNLYIDSDTGSPANIVTNESSAYIQEAGSHKFYSQASGSAGAAVTLSEKMQIDSSGNAIFTKSGGAYLQLKDASAVRGAINVETSDGLVFTTGSSFAERMRINDVGDVLIGGTQEYNTLNGRGNLVVGSGSGNEGMTIVTGTSNTGGINFADGTSGDAAYRGYMEYRHDLDAFVFGTSATERIRIDSSGNIRPATDAGYTGHSDLGTSSFRYEDAYVRDGVTTGSDRNEKENITESNLGLAFIKELQPVSYTWKNNSSNRTHYGLIAQDIETWLSDNDKNNTDFAALIKEDISEEQDGSNYRYGLRYTEFVSPLIKAIQEQQELIETQQTTINDLKSRIETLEG